MAHADALARGAVAFSRGDYIRAARDLSPLAQRGNARTPSLLGFLYEHGPGEPQAYPAAADLYAPGAPQGDPFAQAMLGLMYDKGHGVQQDFGLAYKWLNLATARARGTGKFGALTRHPPIIHFATGSHVDDEVLSRAGVG
jgi:TPR repeat protein